MKTLSNYTGSRPEQWRKGRQIASAGKLTLAVFLTALMGCTSSLLQCGVDGDSSFVTVNANNKLITEGGRNMAELCNFNGANNATQNVQT